MRDISDAYLDFFHGHRLHRYDVSKQHLKRKAVPAGGGLETHALGFKSHIKLRCPGLLMTCFTGKRKLKD
jgi:hypothetical protein